MHPTLAELKAYHQNGGPKEIGTHIKSCERCQTMLDGITNLAEVSKSRDEEVDIIIADSAERVRSKIDMQPKRTYAFLKYAAAIFFILGSSWLLYEYNFKKSLLDKEIAMVYKAPPLLRSSEQLNWSGFQQQYAAENFAMAFEHLEQFESKTGQIAFYKGLCKLYQANADYSGAINYLQSPLVAQSRYSEQATYFSALAFLKMEEIERAKQLLIQISESTDHYKQEEANELLVSY